jgi:hypothetical protein
VSKKTGSTSGAPKSDKTEPVTLGHMGYLAQFGLTAETIKEAGLYSLRRDKDLSRDQMLNKLDIQAVRMGSSPGIVSALAFPYQNCNGFDRLLVWREDWRKWGPHFIQPLRTTNHLYIPSNVNLKGNSQLFVTENEIGALALQRGGFQAIAAGEFWSPLIIYGRVGLPDFSEINWKRLVLVVISLQPYGPIPSFPYFLGKILSALGACVLTLFLPPYIAVNLLGKESLQEQEVGIFLANQRAAELTALANRALWFDPSWTEREASSRWYEQLKSRKAWPEELYEPLARWGFASANY